MKKYTAIKYDFISEDTPSCCGGRNLSSGKAYYLRDNKGDLHYGGKKCASDHSNTNLSLIPDFTTSLISLTKNTATSSSSKRSNIIKNQSYTSDLSKALTYMFLRQDRMEHFTKDLGYNVLEVFMTEYKTTGSLEGSSVERILTLEQNAPKVFSLQNLSTCLATDFIIERSLYHLKLSEPESDLKFLVSIQEWLRKHCNLTDPQVHGVNKWMKWLPDELKLAKLKPFKS